jgi:antitoxin component of RelBE/YafQ-DinJ toxin-antitoxin module
MGLTLKDVIMATTTRKIGRDAKSGEFIPVKEAQKRPNTTVVETIKKNSPTPAKKK